MKSTLTRCFVVAACFWSVSALAQSDPTGTSSEGECTVNADCPANFTCETDNFASCPPCAGEGSVCDPCESDSYSYCMPPPPTQCAADSDCDGSDICVSYTYEACSGGGSVDIACAEDEPCELPPMDAPTCESQTEAYCVPRYVAPCQAASDCGPGFTCEAAELCSCSSGGSMGGDGGSEPSPDQEPDCACEPSGEQYCQVVVVECQTDTDCAQDLECISGPSYETPVAVGSGSDNDVSPEPDSDQASYCLPPGYGYWGSTSGSDAVAQASGANGTLSTSDRISWGMNPNDGGGSKASADGCSTIEGDAALSLFGLLGLVGWFRRRR